MARPSLEGSLPLLVADVYELAGALRRSGDRLAGEVGQSQARWQVLSVVSEGEWTVPTTARRLGVSRQAVQRVADLLVADGLVRFHDNPAHRRSPHLRLTAAGRRTLAAITARSDEQDAALSADLRVTDLATTRRVLRTILDHLESAADEGDDG
jgi:DNA-binding MarR family transcriptional regulator